MTQCSWQEAINPQLLQRLLRPMEQPGVLKDTLAVSIFERANQLLQRLSLLHQFEQRWAGLGALAIDEMPLVYAHWAAVPEESHPIASAVVSRPHSSMGQTMGQTEVVSPPQPTAPLVIQAEVVPTPDSATASPPNASIPKQFSPDNAPQITRNPAGNDFEQTPSHNAVISDAPPSILPGENPVVSQGESTPMAAQLQSLPLQTPIAPGRASQHERQLISTRGEKNHPAGEAVVLATAIAPSSTLPTVKPHQTSDNDWNMPFQSEQAHQLSVSSASSQPSLLPNMHSSVAQQARPSSASLPVSRYPSSDRHSRPTDTPLVVPSESATPINGTFTAGGVISQTTSLPLVRSPEGSAQTAHGDVNAIPAVAMPSKRDNLSPPTPQPIALSNSEINRLTQQVERKLMRRLTVERERRGQQSWR